ncbi:MULTISPECIES: pilus assembly protein [unclassified Acinetobacter]|uniref:pilus assembly protein n=1 Tax=unclassified Acinetobacter TaxID=196816 RepID=UPI00157ADCCE|nr:MULTISPECIES: pilus assembly protein [unclassified Acinetobacter]MDM1756730.1 pilus assembly protein [Acinetobacter sp. 256-1]MDM1761960.1 pilus assembly protein [Acinetobacter sp. 251-1]
MRTTQSLAQQKGMTLITIMIILLLVTGIGALAVKYSITSLRIASNSQVRQLLTQSSDLPLYIIRNKSPVVLRRLDNVVGLAINNSLPDREYIFCYRPQSQKNFAPINNVAQISPYSTTGTAITSDVMRLISGTNSSFCDLNADFGSARTGVVTQVAISLITESAGETEKGEYLPEGTNASGAAHLGAQITGSQRVRITTTSMLPAYSTASISTVQSECLSTSKPRLNDNTEHPSLRTLKDCISDYGIPVVSQTQEFVLANTLIEVSKPE